MLNVSGLEFTIKEICHMCEPEYFVVYYNPQPSGMPLYLKMDGGFSPHQYEARVTRTPQDLERARAYITSLGHRPHWVESDWQPNR